MNKDNKWSISYSWTQPYANWNSPVGSVDQQMAVLNAIDNIVDHMTVYPDAEQLLVPIMFTK